MIVFYDPFHYNKDSLQSCKPYDLKRHIFTNAVITAAQDRRQSYINLPSKPQTHPKFRKSKLTGHADVPDKQELPELESLVPGRWSVTEPDFFTGSFFSKR